MSEDYYTKEETLMLCFLSGYNDVYNLCKTSEDHKKLFDKDTNSVVQATCMLAICQLFHQFGKDVTTDMIEELCEYGYRAFKDFGSIPEVLKNKDMILKYFKEALYGYAFVFVDNHPNYSEHEFMLDKDDIKLVSKKFLEMTQQNDDIFSELYLMTAIAPVFKREKIKTK